MYQRIWDRNINGIREEVVRLWHQRNIQDHIYNRPDASEEEAEEKEKEDASKQEEYATREEDVSRQNKRDGKQHEDVSTPLECEKISRMDTVVLASNDYLRFSEDLSDCARTDVDERDNDDKSRQQRTPNINQLDLSREKVKRNGNLHENVPRMLDRGGINEMENSVLERNDSLSILEDISDFSALENNDDDRLDKDYSANERDTDHSDDEYSDSVDDDDTGDHDDLSHDDDKDSFHMENNAKMFRPKVHARVKACFSRTRGEFEIRHEFGLLHPDTQKINVAVMRVFLKKDLPSKTSIKCPLSFYGERQNKYCYVMYASCKYAECAQRFKFDIAHYPLMPLTIFVYSTDKSEELHPEDKKIHYHLGAQCRNTAKEKLETVMPRKFELDVISKTDVELARAGNMQELRSLNVYQKARSEVNCQYDLQLVSLDLQDLMQFRVNERALSNPYLQHASELNATMFLELTIRAIGPENILSGDATGNCCRAPSCGEYKRILY